MWQLVGKSNNNICFSVINALMQAQERGLRRYYEVLLVECHNMLILQSQCTLKGAILPEVVQERLKLPHIDSLALFLTSILNVDTVHLLEGKRTCYQKVCLEANTDLIKVQTSQLHFLLYKLLSLSIKESYLSLYLHPSLRASNPIVAFFSRRLLSPGLPSSAQLWRYILNSSKSNLFQYKSLVRNSHCDWVSIVTLQPNS